MIMELSQQPQQQAVLPPNMLPPGHPDMQATAYYPEPPNDVTGGLPITLDSLRAGPPLLNSHSVSLCAFVDSAIFLTESIRFLSHIVMPLRAPQIKNYCWRIYTTLLKVGYAGLIVIRGGRLIMPF